MKTILHKAEERGGAEMGWLSTRYSFSFADYRNAERMGFGVLRVLNDDTIAGGGGFGRHGHRDMEIVTIMMEGSLEHADNMGNRAVINKGQIQLMSAGSGIFHSEVNASPTEAVKLFQIWIIPNKLNMTPRYADMMLDPKDRHNKLQTIILPDQTSAGMWLYSNTWFHVGTFDAGKTFEHKTKAKENGLYVFIIQGSVKIGEQVLNMCDALGIWDFDTVTITATTNTEILLMDVPCLLYKSDAADDSVVV
jgi:redox-sensitive bicupin YhaK (pirin superfamily)